MIFPLLMRRLAGAMLSLLLVSALIFALTQVIPGDAATALLGREATPDQVAVLRHTLHLDRPITEQFLSWLDGLAHGDLGQSVSHHAPVSSVIGDRLRNTLLLAGVTALIEIPLAVVLGLLAGIRRNRPSDLLISTGTLVGLIVPEFVVGTVLILLFALVWPVLPAVTTVPANAPLPDLLDSVWLPAVTLTIAYAGYLTRTVRSSVINCLDHDFVQAARLRGLPRWRVWLHHLLPSALLPAVHAAALTLGSLIGGVVVVETLFNYPGIGSLLISAVTDHDLPLVQALALVGAAAWIAVNLAADLVSLALNPRLRTAHV